jgi:hypothetical protein
MTQSYIRIFYTYASFSTYNNPENNEKTQTTFSSFLINIFPYGPILDPTDPTVSYAICDIYFPY